MTYQEAIAFLYSMENTGIKLGLERIRDFMEALGNPQNTYPTVHIAGTNGKGSTSAMIQSILTSAGYKVGLLTSPHLVDYAERNRIDYENCDQDFIIDFVQTTRSLMGKIPVSYFEITTALGFQYFAQKKVDIAVIEVGMGGRLDATNIITPEISIITNIDFDHTKALGNSLELIAAEKAGIIKSNIPCVTACRDNVARKTIRDICISRNARLISTADSYPWTVHYLDLSGCHFDVSTPRGRYGNVFTNLSGRHQVENAVTAMAAIECLDDRGFKISKENVLTGIGNAHWRGRLQLISQKPLILADVAHNGAGMKTLKEAIQELLPQKNIIVVLGILSDKDYSAMMDDIGQFAATLIIAKPVTKRAADPRLLAERAQEIGIQWQIIPEVSEAFEKALSIAGDNDVIIVTGSHYTVGEVLANYENMKC